MRTSTGRDRALALAERHGFNAVSFQSLDEGYEYAFFGDDACVAYVDTGRAWVVAGAPLASTDRLAAVAVELVERARKAGRRCCFFATEPRFVGATDGALAALRIGEQPIWNPREWTEILRGHKSLREQLRRARAKGIVVREVLGAELVTDRFRLSLKALITRWHATRAMAPMGFLVGLRPLGFAAPRRCFVAEREGALVGFASVVPVPERAGSFIEHVIREPRAPNGTSELLVDAVMRAAAADGGDWLTLGLAPLAGDVPSGLRAARRGGALLYDFEGLRAYKAKLRPARWDPLFLSYPHGQSSIGTLVDVLAAFTNGGFVRFALRSLLRGSSAVLVLLAFLLLPWTLLLASVPAERWFYAPLVKWAWVGFDTCLFVALFVTLRRPRSSRFLMLAVAVTADACLTTLQAVLWNAPRARSTADWLALAVGWAAPVLAARVLWGARARTLHIDPR